VSLPRGQHLREGLWFLSGRRACARLPAGEISVGALPSIATSRVYFIARRLTPSQIRASLFTAVIYGIILAPGYLQFGVPNSMQRGIDGPVEEVHVRSCARQSNAADLVVGLWLIISPLHSQLQRVSCRRVPPGSAGSTWALRSRCSPCSCSRFRTGRWMTQRGSPASMCIESG